MYISILKSYNKKIKDKKNIKWVSLKNNLIEIYIVSNKYTDRYCGKFILAKINNKEKKLL